MWTLRVYVCKGCLRQRRLESRVGVVARVEAQRPRRALAASALAAHDAVRDVRRDPWLAQVLRKTRTQQHVET